MRALVLGFAVLLSVAAEADAQSAPPSEQDAARNESLRLRMLQFDTQYIRPAASDDARLIERDERASRYQAFSQGGISFGPVRMDLGTGDTGNDGKRAHFAHVHLEDVHLWGGNVSGTFDGRAATLRLSWPTGN